MEDVPPMRKAFPTLFTKVIISKGYGFNTPQTGSVCKIKVISDEANLLDCQENEVKEIIIGDVDKPVDQIIEDCIRTMKEGEEAIMEFKQHSLFPGFIQNAAPLQFQLTSFSNFPEIREMSMEEKWSKASHHKQRGLDLYACQEYEYAFRHFGLTLKYIISLELDGLKPENMDVIGLKFSSYLNLAACQLKHKNYESVVINSTKALKIKPNDVKALYRRGAAYVQLQEYEKAEDDLVSAQRLEPNNQAISRQLQELKVCVQKLNQYYAQAMKKMFS